MAKSAHFFLVKTTDPIKKLAKLYLKEIVCLHCAQSQQCQTRMLGSLQLFGENYKRILVHDCVLDFPGSWAEREVLMEYAYNNNYYQSLEISPYKALYGRKCRSPIHWHEASERKFLGLEEVDKVTKEIGTIKKRLQASVHCQKKYMKNRR